MAVTVAQVRQKIGERVPSGGTESDTLFLDSEVQEWIDDAGGDLAGTLLSAWVAKAAEVGNQVDTAKGNASEALSDLHKHAMEMVKLYGGSAAMTRVTRVHSIVRPGR